jgi:drug/metabolite transporter (DMT)-like permease
MYNKGINRDNITDYAILAISNSISMIFIQLFVISHQIIYFILSIASFSTFFYFNYKMILNKYDVILVSAVGKIIPVFAILIFNILFLKQNFTFINLILGAFLIIAGIYLIQK